MSQPLPPDTYNGPTETDEVEVLSDLYGEADEQGVFRAVRYGADVSVLDVLAPTGVAGMLAEARKTLGMGEPNAIQAWYRSRNGTAFNYNFPWCQASITKWAHDSGNYAAVCPRGDRAYTVYGAQDGEYLKKWYAGTEDNIRKYAKPGAVVFFDWGGSNTVGRVDHVGVCEKNLGDGRLQTIEGNTANVCARRVRGSGDIAGFWNPAYVEPAPKPVPTPPAKPKVTVPSGTPYLELGSQGARVKQLQAALNAARKAGLMVDGEFGPKTEAALKSFQKAAKLSVDGVYGPKSATALKKAVG